VDTTLDDLLILEPRLVLDEEAAASQGSASVSWVVSARTTPPHLPLLRGGEIVIVSERVMDVVGDELPALLHEAVLREVRAVVMARTGRHRHRTYPQSAALPVPILRWNDDLTADTEAGLNRLLTECRGNLYRIGTELERQISDAAAGQLGAVALVQSVSHMSGLPVSVFDASGQRLAAAPEDSDEADGVVMTPDPLRPVYSLPSEAKLVLGPLRPEQQVLARFLGDRIAAAAGAALQRDRSARPRGARRVDATGTMLCWQGSASEQRAAALALGLDPDGIFYVAISSGNEPSLARELGTLGSTLPAGGEGGQHVVLVAADTRAVSGSLASRVAEVKRRWEADHADDESSLAISAPAMGVASIPNAMREAKLVATLQAQRQIARRAASFGSIDDVGPMRLLYQLRDAPELQQFIAEALGGLEGQDPRGTLRSTLRAFLESGGSQVDASQKLGIHRNTLAYRLRRIGELIGREITDPGAWLTLHLALSAAEMLAAKSDER
jgi:purine catabolism regulator